MDSLLELVLSSLIGDRLIGDSVTLISFVLTELLLAYWRFVDGLVNWRLRLGLRFIGWLVLTCFDSLEAETDFDSIPASGLLLRVRQLCWRLRLGLLIGARLVFTYWRSFIGDLITLTSFCASSFVGDWTALGLLEI